MSWAEAKSQLASAVVGLITGAVLAGGSMLFTINAKLDSISTELTEYKLRMDERHENYQEALADFKSQLTQIKTHRNE